MGNAGQGRAEGTREIRAHTGLRGVAALMVVAYHLQFGAERHLAFEDATPIFRRSYLFVDLFFVLSGFIISYVNDAKFAGGVSRTPYRRFLATRFARIYPLLFVTLGGMVLERAVFSALLAATGRAPAISWDAWSLGVLALQYVMLNAIVPGAIAWNIPSWSISAELFAYLLYPLATMLLARRRAIGSVALIGVALTFYAWVLGYGGSLDIVSGGAPLRCLAGFALGMVIHALRHRTAALPAALLGILQLAATAGIVFLLAYPVGDSWIMIPFALLVSTSWSDRGIVARLLGTAPARWLGLISYSIYLDHLLIIEALGYVRRISGFERMMSEGDTPRIAWILLCYAGTLSGAALTYRFVEIPGRAWLNARLLHRRPSPIETAPPAP